MIKKIIIASQNPVKIAAVKSGFEKMFSQEKFEFEGVSVPSGVQDQPMGDKMTLTGAFNRAENAMAKLPHANFWVGIEGGIEKNSEGEMQAFAWIVIRSRNSTGKGKTGTFFLPYDVVELINKGKELGEADDLVFGQNNSKQKNGAVGLLTENVINRSDLYSQGVVLALIPFKQPKYYQQKTSSFHTENLSEV